MDDRAADGLRVGDRVFARGDLCTLVSRTTHADCEAVRLARITRDRVAPGDTRTLLLPFDRIRPQHVSLAPRVVSPRRWASAMLAAVASAPRVGGLDSARSARIDLLPFQWEPALAMLRFGHLRVLIADQVGLGKTIQAGLLLAELSTRDDGFRAIVVTPAGLREQWRRELGDRFALDAISADAAWLSLSSRELPPEVNPWSLPGIYLASLDLVKRPEVLRALEDVTWDFFALDEAHAAGAGTARLAAACALGVRARRILLLTATPPDGDPLQLAAMCNIGRLRDDDPLVEFRRTRADAGFPNGRRTVLLQVRLSAAERRMHRLLDRYTRMVWAEAGTRQDPRARLAATVLRKRALSSAWSLATSVSRRIALLDAGEPPPSELQLLLPLVDEDPIEDDLSDRVLGAAGLADGRTERALLRQIERIATRASSHESKLAFLLRFLRRAGEPVIVFTEYRDTLLHLERALRDAGLDPLLLHGGLPPRERSAVQRAFNDRGTLLLATDAASEGLNLHTRCRVVVHFELPWTPARLEQRTGRVDRMGQSRRVHEVLLVARHTAERMVLAPLVRRARMAQRHGGRSFGAVAALTESRVTEAVMEGRPVILPDCAACESMPPPALQDDARREVERIEFQRRALSGHPAAGGPLITVRHRREARVLTLVFCVSVESRDGRCVHSTIVPLALDARGFPIARRASERIALILRAADGDAGRLAESAASAGVRAATSQQEAAVQALHRREQSLADSLPSTARRLVQAGLFDRRGMQQADAQRHIATLLAEGNEDHELAMKASASLTTRVTLVGARLDVRESR